MIDKLKTPYITNKNKVINVILIFLTGCNLKFKNNKSIEIHSTYMKMIIK
jgi:hypothetical protein